MVNVAIRMDEYHAENPFAAVKSIRLPEVELAYLTHDQIDALFDELKQSRNAHVTLIATLCLTVAGGVKPKP
jgi:site-specific recombinase XerD